jgi:hypothetical protein
MNNNLSGQAKQLPRTIRAKLKPKKLFKLQKKGTRIMNDFSKIKMLRKMRQKPLTRR